MKKHIGIIGASGYTGFELIKLLDKRSELELVALNSESSAGKKVSELYPEYKGKLTFTNYTLDEINKLKPDLTFLCMGEGYAKDAVKKLKCKVIDLSRDLRLSDEAVYGLPELFRDKIRKAQVVSNPGCYATACILAALPLAKENMINRIIFDCKSGYSGAGRTPSYLNDPENYTDNVIPYKITQHQHMAEINKCIRYFSPKDIFYSTPSSGIDYSEFPEIKAWLNKGMADKYNGFSEIEKYRTLSFGDICRQLENEEIKFLLNHIDIDTIATVLWVTSPGIKKKLFGNMPKEIEDKVKAKIDSMEPVKVSVMEDAQERMVKSALKLADEDKIKLFSAKVSFTPHVISAFRGLMSTAHVMLKFYGKWRQIYTDFYKTEPFVKIVDKLPELHDVQNTNYCHIGGFEIDDTGQLVIISALDNLLKGASGQAVQNMNLMLGFEETEGLI